MRGRRLDRAVAALLASLLAAAPAARARPAEPVPYAEAARAVVVSQHPLASAAGLDVLRAGGNAVDAAVAAALALAVVHPQAGNLGGGGFLLLWRALDGFATCIDFRETAPAGAEPGAYVDAAGVADTMLLRHSHMSAGVPGTPAGLFLAWSKYGRLPWKALVAPALLLAQEGFPVNAELAADLQSEAWRLERHPATAAALRPSGVLPRAGSKLVLPELAATLRHLAHSGPLAFYEGTVADLIAREMEAGGGLVTRADLAAYRAVERAPLRGRYRDCEVLAVPPPSSGGVTLLEILAMLEAYDLGAMQRLSAPRVHVAVEAMARAFADRNTYLGDPAFVRVPVAGLLAPAHIASRRQGISFERATPAAFVRPGDAWAHEPIGPPAGDARVPALADTTGARGESTTHLSVVDADGNAVALTTTLNSSFGSGVVVAGAGFLLNNEMDDFSLPGAANQFGLTGGGANGIAPGKRMLSSMAPTIVLRDGKPWLVLGSRGGPRIITGIANVLLDVRDHGLPLREAVASPRYHHQWQPDLLWHEPGAFPDDVRAALLRLGHTLRERSRYGGVNAIEVGPDGTRRGVADPRSPGAAAGY